MANDTNRGRDLPRGPKFLPIEGKPKSEQIGDPIKLARRREKVKKELEQFTHRRGFNQLFTTSVGIPEKQKLKERKLVLEALALGLPVHSGMLALHGLTLQPNPKSIPSDPNESVF